MKTHWQSGPGLTKSSLRTGLAALAAGLLASAAAQAAVYVGSANDLGTGPGAIYQYSSTGDLLATTDPGFSGGSGVLLTAQAGTGALFASSGGFLQKVSPNLSSRQVVGSGFGSFTSLASLSDGRILAGATVGGNALHWWDATGVYAGAFGNGWLDSTIAVGLNETVFTTYNAGAQTNLGTWTSNLAFIDITASNTGPQLAVNLASGQLWTAGNAAGQIMRLNAAGGFIDVVGNAWNDALIASAGDGTIWVTSSVDGGILASFGSDGSYQGISQSGIGEVAALAVDPQTGEIYVGLKDVSGGGINRYAANGSFLDTFGSQLGITSLLVVVPEPTTLALVVSCAGLVLLRLRRRAA